MKRAQVLGAWREKNNALDAFMKPQSDATTINNQLPGGFKWTGGIFYGYAMTFLT
jgi:hypothetical protein